jgi:uncharacterized protein YjbI with pentapeptide repeats
MKTKEEINQILTAHIKWVRGEEGGYRADLSGANLSRADLSGANLSGADLYGANLSGANLFRADLSGANLSRADLSGANLSRADLSGANLFRADLYGANLYGANLSRADLYGANLSGVQGAIQINTSKFMIVVTETHTKVGCQYKTHREWAKVTKKQAVEMGLPATHFKTYKLLIDAARKQLKAQVSK